MRRDSSTAWPRLFVRSRWCELYVRSPCALPLRAFVQVDPYAQPDARESYGGLVARSALRTASSSTAFVTVC